MGCNKAKADHASVQPFHTVAHVAALNEAPSSKLQRIPREAGKPGEGE
jgi:hypothetical protein